MRRDWGLIRDILLCLENGSEPGLDESYRAHVAMLINGGFVRGGNVGDAQRLREFTLTWKGHDLVDDIRDDVVWHNVVKAHEAIGGLTTDIVLGIAKRSRQDVLSRADFIPMPSDDYEVTRPTRVTELCVSADGAASIVTWVS